MEDIISKLYTLIPVVLVIIWVIQYIEKFRRRSKRQTANRAKDKSLASLRKGSSTPLPGKKASKQGEIFPNYGRIPAQDSPPPPIAKAKSDSPKEQSGRMAVSYNLEQGARVVRDKASHTKSLVRRRTLNDIRARSPLAQAMLWKIILDRPSALKELDE